MKKDALDILLFHQFGNYVMQRMLKVGKSSETRVYHMVVIMGVESRFVSSCASTSRRLPVYTTTTDGEWLARLEERIHRSASRLAKYAPRRRR